MRKFIIIALVFLILAGGILTWMVFGYGTGFTEKTHSFIIPEGETGKASVVAVLKKEGIILNGTLFSLLGSQAGIWTKIRAGKYEVKKGESLWDITRMLKNGRLAEYRLLINKLRIKEDLARLISKKFAPDSVSVMRYLTSNDSLKKFGVDTSNVFSLILPDTYIFYWNTPLGKIFTRLAETNNAFWQKNQRLEKAKSQDLTPKEVYILASIVEEETNHDSDKPLIAGVYMNRLKLGMPLQADPTVKFAMKDFKLNRIYLKYLSNPSPYNTYRLKGLPPGPICTPSAKTIDRVLEAPKTDYLFFVAKSDFSGYHQFSSNFTEHKQYAKEYQKALDAYMARKQQNTPKP